MLALLTTWRDQFSSLTGFSVGVTDAQMLHAANYGYQSLADFARFMSTQSSASTAIKRFPWAGYGLTRDEYVQASTSFGTTYKEITGQDISAEALAKAFKNPRDPTGGLLNATQYKQQLMNDASIQAAYGWVKYGMDFSAWTQQKLQMHSAFGRDVTDAEASTILQYNKAATGPNMAALARTAQGQGAPASAGVGGAVTR